ncbi:hypothetical protein IPC1111_15365 [Pseudomonas aeruginosa]|nr:hypothetical protein IPC1111_15365 [Pseudomonas aeruginosa]
MDDLLQRVRRCEALQQPEWGDPSRLRDVQAYLRGSPALIRAGDILALRATLARVARGDGKIKRNREFMNVFQQLRALSIPVPQIKREGIPT